MVTKTFYLFEQLEFDYVLFKEPSMDGSNTAVDSNNLITVDDVVKRSLKKITKLLGNIF